MRNGIVITFCDEHGIFKWENDVLVNVMLVICYPLLNYLKAFN